MSAQKCSRLNVLVAILVWLPPAGHVLIANDENVSVDRFKIHGDGDCLLVPVDIDGKEHLFLVDTGSSFTSIDRTLLASDVKGEVKVRSGAGEISVKQFDVPAARLRQHDLKAELPWVAGLDMSEMREVSGHEIYGILGMDFLINRVVEIDFDGGELVLRTDLDALQAAIKSREAAREKGLSERSRFSFIFDYGSKETDRPMNIAFQRNVPVTMAMLKYPSTFAIDTGHVGGCSGTIKNEVVTVLIFKKELKVVGSTESLTFKGNHTARLLRGTAFSHGRYELKDPLFCEGNGDAIGLHYLSRYHVTLDFPGKKLHLREGKQFAKPDLTDASGLHVLKRANEYVVHSVDWKSAGNKSNIRRGDVILRVDGKSIDQIRLYELRKMLCEAGRSIEMVVRRGNEEFKTTIELDEEMGQTDGSLIPTSSVR
jgi:hypothetical protein